MAELDPSRATFVRSEYRPFVARDDRINASYDNTARTVEINTNLDGAAAQALANKIFAATKNDALSFELIIEGTVELSRLIGPNPTIKLNASRFNLADRVMRVTSVNTDYDTNTTTLQVRG